MVRLPYMVPGCSRFLGRLEHTCGTRAQQEDSVGFEPTTSQHLRVSRCGSTAEPSPTPFQSLGGAHPVWIVVCLRRSLAVVELVRKFLGHARFRFGRGAFLVRLHLRLISFLTLIIGCHFVIGWCYEFVKKRVRVRSAV